jgi:uncharacterized protein (DUF58 family)
VTFPLLCWIVLAVFLGCLGLFALAVTRVVAPDGQGHARGFLGGLAALIALAVLGGLGFLGLGAAVVAIGVGSAIDWNPIRRIEIQRSEPRESEDSPAEVRARFTVRGDAGGEVLGFLRELVDVDLTDLEEAMTVQRRVDERGRVFDVYEFRLPISEDDLEDFERDLERELDGMDVRLPRGVDIQFDGVD